MDAHGDRSLSLDEAQRLALRGIVPVAALVLVPFVLVHGWAALAAGAAWWGAHWLWGLGAFVAGVVVHEGLHALAWLVIGRVPVRSVSFGILWEGLAPYAHTAAPMTADAYRIAAALPGAVLGVAPILAAWTSGSGALLLFGLVFTLTAAGDALVVWVLRGVDGRRLVRDHPSRVGCLLAASEPLTQTRVGPAIPPAHPMADLAIRTSHTDPALDGADRSDAWNAGIDYETFLPTAADNVGLWTSNWERGRAPEDLVERAEAVPGHWHLLVMSADWCGDASNTMPVLARFAEAASNVELRLVERDDHLDLMDEHLTGGTARAIPIVIVLDGEYRERGWWGPRPADLQAWFKTEGQTLDKDARYRELRKWYARDRGRTTIEEVLALIESAGGSGHVA